MSNVIELSELESILLKYFPKSDVWNVMPLIRQKTFYLNKKEKVKE